MRLRAVYFAPLLWLVSDCVGGQTTVPTSLVGPACSPAASQQAAATRRELASAFVGSRVIDVVWERFTPGVERVAGSSQLTLEVSDEAAAVDASSCLAELRVSTRFATADGTLALSGVGSLSGNATLAALVLDGLPNVSTADVELSVDAVEARFTFGDGSTLSLRRASVTAP